MTDCPNAEMRDLLPDLLHERLDPSARAAVMAHVAKCAECRAELALMREARIALTSDMRIVDVAAIASAVVARTSAPVVYELPRQRRAQRWIDWRIAASIALVAVGAASFAAIRARQSAPARVEPIAPQVALDTPKATVVAKTPESVTPAMTPTPAAAAELSAAGGVSDLSEDDLRALVDDLDSIAAEPATDPEPVSVHVTLPGRGGIE